MAIHSAWNLVVEGWPAAARVKLVLRPVAARTAQQAEHKELSTCCTMADPHVL
jgi:hypothetical protein